MCLRVFSLYTKHCSGYAAGNCCWRLHHVCVVHYAGQGRQQPGDGSFLADPGGPCGRYDPVRYLYDPVRYLFRIQL